ncbi:MAG: hypothetical protein K0U93_18395 [Gammaproteobacteria bacterium]|nr:hypothetical protein [Gammaproteobacteria bacterium]
MSDRTSHWRVLWSPAGAGHALFMVGRLTDQKVRIYSDNIAVARWLQRTIEAVLFADFANTDIPVTAAAFDRFGDGHSNAVEVIESDDEIIRMTWYDMIEPFVVNAPPGTAGRPIGVFTTFFPAQSAQLSVNDRVATGTPWSEMREDRQSSSAVLAWSETWVAPRD